MENINIQPGKYKFDLSKQSSLKNKISCIFKEACPIFGNFILKNNGKFEIKIIKVYSEKCSIIFKDWYLSNYYVSKRSIYILLNLNRAQGIHLMEIE